MTELNILDNKLEQGGKLNLDLNLEAININVAVVHQVIKAILATRRQGNACTKNKSEVSGGGKKPFKQKGTGNARQGSTRSPLMPGGGTVFGPTPRSYEQKVNKRMMNKAIHSVLTDKYQAGKLVVIEKLNSDGKTKSIAKALSSSGLSNSLIVLNDGNDIAHRAIRNLERSRSLTAETFSVYEAVKYEILLIEKQALEKLAKRLV